MSSTMYSVNAFVNGAFVLQSDQFTSKEQALNLLTILQHESKSMVFEVYESTSTATSTSTSPDFYGMTIESHGKGYLLRPYNGDERVGTKYFHGGFWMPKHDAWFFTKSFYGFLVDSGAVDIKEETITTKFINYDERFSCMTLVNHGKGLLMTCDEADTQFKGAKYMKNPKGYWNPKLKGWTYSSSVLDDLINQGAVYVKEKENDETLRFTDMEFKEYGNGLLMWCVYHNDSRDGIKYLHNPTGYWNVKLDGWVFNHSVLDELIEHGATYIGSEAEEVDEAEEEATEEEEEEEEETEEEEEEEELFANLTYQRYGKGYLLNAGGDTRAGTKYFHGGFWMPSKDGWFFKKSFREFIRENGARK
jgi:hypothetical protein